MISRKHLIQDKTNQVSFFIIKDKMGTFSF